MQKFIALFFSNFYTLCGTFLVISSRPFSIPKPMPTFSKSLQAEEEELFSWCAKFLGWCKFIFLKWWYLPIPFSGLPGVVGKPTQGFFARTRKTQFFGPNSLHLYFCLNLNQTMSDLLSHPMPFFWRYLLMYEKYIFYKKAIPRNKKTPRFYVYQSF